MRAEVEPVPLTIEVLVDGTMQTINDEVEDHPYSVIGKILSTRVEKGGVDYRLLDCGHDKELPLDSDHVVFYHCGLAAPPGKFKGHVITTPAGTTTGATDDGQDQLAHQTFEAICKFIDAVTKKNPDREIRLNFAGYSRGAIVVGHLTNELHKRYGKQPLIVLNRAVGIDPVAGSSSGCLLANEKKLNDHKKKPAKFPPVNTKVWGPVKKLNLYYATEGTRAHFQAQTPHGITTDRGRRVVNFYDATHVTVTNIATSHYAIACIVDSDEAHCAFPVLIMECFLKDRDLPRFGDDQLLNTAMPYRVSMEQIRVCLMHYAGICVREIESFGLFWKIANLFFTGSHRYQRPLIARAILTEDHPVLHASYHRSVMMDAVGFINQLIAKGYIKQSLSQIAHEPKHSLHRFFIECYKRSSFYASAHETLQRELPDKSADAIDAILVQDVFLKLCAEQIARLPYSTTKQQLSEMGQRHALKYLDIVKKTSVRLVAHSMQMHMIKRVAATAVSRANFLTGPKSLRIVSSVRPSHSAPRVDAVVDYSAGVEETKGDVVVSETKPAC